MRNYVRVPPPPPRPPYAQRENLGVSRLKMRNVMRKLTHTQCDCF